MRMRNKDRHTKITGTAHKNNISKVVQVSVCFKVAQLSGTDCVSSPPMFSSVGAFLSLLVTSSLVSFVGIGSLRMGIDSLASAVSPGKLELGSGDGSEDFVTGSSSGKPSPVPFVAGFWLGSPVVFTASGMELESSLLGMDSSNTDLCSIFVSSGDSSLLPMLELADSAVVRAEVS